MYPELRDVMEKTNRIDVDPKDLGISDVYQLITRAVAPRPIAFVSSMSRDGVGNLAPFSYFNAGGANPPSVVFSPLRTRENAEKDTLRNIRETGEYVINVVPYRIRERMNITSAPFPPEVNEFEQAGFTPFPSVKVKPPGVLESPINLECRLFKVVSHGDGPLSANYIIGQVVYMRVCESVWMEETVHPPGIHAIGRMGADWYCRTESESLFELPKPTLENVEKFKGRLR
jgi:flavin reductase (DIM6/NTAB) family NADH-FMN oxidoreductase RutF